MATPLETLANLAKLGSLKPEAPDPAELAGLIQSGRARLRDAETPSLALESRIDLAYNASHALALAALRWHGYRADSRYLVFQCLTHTLGLPPAAVRVLDTCHRRRNVAEYEGHLEVEASLVTDLIATAKRVLDLVDKLGAISPGTPPP
jgi:hypothetical protein